MNCLRAGLLCAAMAAAAASAEPPMVEWPMPAAASVRPQTDVQADLGRTAGRPLPEPEILQPTLDPGLASYRPRTGGALVGSVTGAASDVLPGLVHSWIERFTKFYPEVRIRVPPPYAGSLGAKELVQGKLDFVFVSRELKPDDISDFREKYGYPPLSVPICGGTYRHFGFLDAIGFFVSKDNPLEKISFAQLDAIYSSTRHRGGAPILRWGQLGLTGDWADRPIHAYGIRPWNGFEEFIRQRVLSSEARRGEWRSDLEFEKVVFPLAQRVAQDRYGIGYAGIAYIDAGVKVLPVAVADSGPYFAPTYANVASADYPLSRLIFFNTRLAPGKPMNPILQEFLRFILSKDGQQAVRDQGIYLPLRAPQAARSLDSLTHLPKGKS